MLDHDGRFTFVNRKAEVFLGVSRDRLLGRFARDVFPADPSADCAGRCRRALSDRTVETFEMRSPQSEHAWVEVTLVPSDEGLTIFFHDITARRETERNLTKVNRELRQRVNEFETLLDVLPVGIGLARDPQASDIRTNRAFARMLALPQDANASLTAPAAERPNHFRVLQHGRELKGHELPLQVAAREGRELHDFEVDVVFDSGDRIRLLEYAAPLFDETGTPSGSVGAFIDITDRGRIEEQRQQMLEAERAARTEAERTNRIKDEFLASLSHELRTPLNAILGWAQVLRRRHTGPELIDHGLATLERNAKLQAQLIDDLLDMSRILSGKVRLDVQQVELMRIVEAAVDAVRPSADVKNITVTTVLDPRAGPVAADPTRLHQVIWNLLTNAVKLTDRGGRVHVMLSRVAAHLEISVSDTGIGIAPEFLPHVFERFRQGDASTTRRYGGLGIGLSIVKQLTELHGGTVRAFSDGPERGSTFVISLPVWLPWAGEPGPVRLQARTAVETAGPPREVSLHGIDVLVIDDDAETRQLIALILQHQGAEVTTVESTDEALAAVRRRTPHVIVSDIGLPGRDGYDFIRCVRSMGGPVAETPALALTAFARAEDRRRALLAGFQVHVSKPVEPAELCAAVASLAKGQVDRDMA
jgi:PAS domain S-box-containing protein